MAAGAREAAGFATAEVQISETETPLHRLETVYRRLIERLSTGDSPTGALRSIVDGWFYALEQDVLAEGTAASGEEPQLIERTKALMEQRLAEITTRRRRSRRLCARTDPLWRERHGDGRRAYSPGSAANPMWARASSGLPGSRATSITSAR